MKKILCLVFCLFLTACAQKHSFLPLENSVVDQETGLVWAKSANPAGKPLLWKSDDNVYAFIMKLNDDNYSGYGDWRVPTKDEMASLIAYAKTLGYEPGKYETWPFQRLRQLGFTDVRDYAYWTSTRASGSTLWVADLASGEVLPKSDAKRYFLWPVRGGRSK